MCASHTTGDFRCQKLSATPEHLVAIIRLWLEQCMRSTPKYNVITFEHFYILWFACNVWLRQPQHSTDDTIRDAVMLMTKTIMTSYFILINYKICVLLSAFTFHFVIYCCEFYYSISYLFSTSFFITFSILFQFRWCKNDAFTSTCLPVCLCVAPSQATVERS